MNSSFALRSGSEHPVISTAATIETSSDFMVNRHLTAVMALYKPFLTVAAATALRRSASDENYYGAVLTLTAS